MKSIKITIITILIMSFVTITQAQTNNWFVTKTSNELFFKGLFPAGQTNRCADVNTPLTDAEIDDIIRIHNQVRAEVGTAPLKWNCNLAKFSQNWANADTFEHSTQQQREQIISGGGVAGENLAIDSGSTATMAALNKGWIDEKQFWDNNSNTCAAGKVCGHYTQMVWKTTNEVGCGIIRNSKKLGEEFSSSYLVCTYYPGGNVAGEKPY